MSEQLLTFEGIMEFMRETARVAKKRDAAFHKRMKEAELRMKRTDEKIGKLTDNIGKMVENMVGGEKIIKQFQEKFGYIIESHSRNKTFGHSLSDDMKGEIDLFLENGDIAILIEVKTTLRRGGVSKCMRTLKKFRCYSDTRGDKRRFIGAVAAASIKGDDVVEFAHKNGLYVIVQSGEAVEIVPTPEGFRAKEW